MLRKRNEFRDHNQEVRLFKNRAIFAFLGHGYFAWVDCREPVQLAG